MSQFFNTAKLFFVLLLLIVKLNAQKTNAILYFNDGVKKEGFAKFKGTDKVKFKKSKKSKPIIYFWKDLDKVSLIEEGNGSFHFFYRKIKGTESHKPLHLVSDGKVKLYREVVRGCIYYNAPNNVTDVPNTIVTNFESFYISKDDSNEVIYLDDTSEFGENFKEESASFFSDYEEVMTKINNGEYKKEHIRDIVFHYNFKCKF